MQSLQLPIRLGSLHTHLLEQVVGACWQVAADASTQAPLVVQRQSEDLTQARQVLC